MVKSKLAPRSGCSLEAVEPHPLKRGRKVFLKFKILISKKEPYGKKNSLKYFLGYNDVIRPFCIKLPQMIGYVKSFDSTNTVSSKG